MVPDIDSKFSSKPMQTFELHIPKCCLLCSRWFSDLHDVIGRSILSLYAYDSKMFKTMDKLEDSTKMSEDVVRLEN